MTTSSGTGEASKDLREAPQLAAATAWERGDFSTVRRLAAAAPASERNHFDNLLWKMGNDPWVAVMALGVAGFFVFAVLAFGALGK